MPGGKGGTPKLEEGGSGDGIGGGADPTGEGLKEGN